MRIWTDAARKAQAEAIRRWQPWRKSTGPRSEAGKSRSRLNACKQALPHKQRRALAAVLTRQNAFRKAYEIYLEVREQLNPAKRTIIRHSLDQTGQAIINDLKRCLAALADPPDSTRRSEIDPALSPCGIRMVA